jgi:hypothetical protein
MYVSLDTLWYDLGASKDLDSLWSSWILIVIVPQKFLKFFHMNSNHLSSRRWLWNRFSVFRSYYEICYNTSVYSVFILFYFYLYIYLFEVIVTELKTIFGCLFHSKGGF